MTVADKILILLEENGELSIKEMVERLEVSKQAVHKSINSLLEKQLIKRFGRAPKTIYKLHTQKPYETQALPQLEESQEEFLNEHFLLIDEIGEFKEGLQGFAHWCYKRKLPLEKSAIEFFKTKQKYLQYFNSNAVIDGKTKLENTKGYEKVYLDEVYYLDFYAIERFGKTKLGTILHYAKQGQNKFLMKLLVEQLKSKLQLLLANHSFQAIGFVPPTIKRELQLMKYMEAHLKFNLPKVKIQKISGIIPVPQKSLNKIEERISNAENTFLVSETIQYQHVLLLDDAMGSGATLNQIAKKLKQKKVAQKVTGLAIVGSFKGFDVITDV
ncbi:MAG: MarR family transcriptional regulator [Spirochaetota bacterium]